MIVNTFERGFLHVVFTSSYLNLIVKAPKHSVKHATGLCATKHPHKKGDLFFEKYKHHKDHHVDPPKPCDVKEGTRKCKKAGVPKSHMKTCLADFCKGINPKDAEKIHDVIIHDKPKPPPRGPTKNCQMFADPHVVGFAGYGFNAQTPGDWTLYKGLHMETAYRGESHGAWVGISKFGVIVYRHKITSIGFDLKNIEIDGEIKKLKNGRTNLSNGAYLLVSGNKITISTGDGEEVDYISYSNYFYNAYVRSNINAAQQSGICSHQFHPSNYFNHPEAPKEDPRVHHCERKKHFMEICKTKNLRSKVALDNCVFDFCQGMRGKTIDKIHDQGKKRRKETCCSNTSTSSKSKRKT